VTHSSARIRVKRLTAARDSEPAWGPDGPGDVVNRVRRMLGDLATLGPPREPGEQDPDTWPERSPARRASRASPRTLTLALGQADDAWVSGRCPGAAVSQQAGGPFPAGHSRQDARARSDKDVRSAVLERAVSRASGSARQLRPRLQQPSCRPAPPLRAALREAGGGQVRQAVPPFCASASTDAWVSHSDRQLDEAKRALSVVASPPRPPQE
jgi:hypothetical protein